MDQAELLQFGRIVVVGGGCYGSFYARQLRRARAAGKVEWRELIVVDRDEACRVAREVSEGARVVVREWTSFFAEYLAAAVADAAGHHRDAIVPSPLMPHLLFEWLRDRARARPGGANIAGELPGELPAVPWQRPGTDGTRYASYATWTCPVNCIEPKKCPHTGGPRDWSFHTSLAAPATAVLRVTHRTFGVGMIDVADVIAADALVARNLDTATDTDAVVRIATASHCHGAVAGLRRRIAP